MIYMNWAKLGVLVSMLLLCACRHNERLERALEFAGENRAELEKVLVHYKDSGLKLDAARFLIENMPRHYAYVGKQLDSVRAAKATIAQRKYLAPELEKWKSVAYQNTMVKVYDAKVMTSDYLIDNIDLAFDAWKKRSWNEKVTFDEFCELILPYRIADEPLTDWRRKYVERYSAVLDSIYPDGRDVVETVRRLIAAFDAEGWVYNEDFNVPRYGASFLMDYRVGGCRESCDFSVYVMRSLGIPVSTDFYLYSPGIQHGHLWNVVKDTTGLYVPFWFREFRAERGGNDGRKKGKVYRISFGQQKEKVKGIYENTMIPGALRDPYVKDVTNEYFTANSLEVEVDCDKESKYAFLSVFSPFGWVPVDVGKVVQNKARFKNVEPGVVFAPIANVNGVMQTVGYSFRFIDGKVVRFHPAKEKEDVVLLRKYPVAEYLREWMSGVVGARIEGADTPEFIHSELIYEIKQVPEINYNAVILNPRRKYRYVRYTAPQKIRAEIAELALYRSANEVNPLSVKILRAAAPVNGNAKLGADAMFDNDYLTYYHTQDSVKTVIIDLGQPEYIGKMVYIPRNDDNFISPGDMYELFYQNGSAGWVSLGKQMAQEQQLIYKNVPQNALLWLRDLSRGREEQVFWIENGKQVFLGK